MEEIRIEKPAGGDKNPCTLLLMEAMEILDAAAISSPGSRFEVDAPDNATEIIIKTTSTQVANVLRAKLPEKGYKIKDIPAGNPWPEPPPSIH